MKSAEEWWDKFCANESSERHYRITENRLIQADAIRYCGARLLALAQGSYRHPAEAMVRELLKEADRLEGK